MAKTRQWKGFWIASTQGWIDTGREYGRDRNIHSLPTPYFRKSFNLEAKPGKAFVYLASAGWHELYINGRKADDRVLAPCVSQFNIHINYIEYDVTELLQKGSNAVTILLGNGEFNAQSADVWNFNHASWRDFPRLCCDLIADGECIAATDNTWKFATGALVFDSIRSGETWDCSKDIQGVADADFDDSAWAAAYIVRPPAGVPVKEEMEPCRICSEHPAVEIRTVAEDMVLYDFGKNYTGWVSLAIEAVQEITEPLEITLTFGERINPDGTPDNKDISILLTDGWETQVCRIILAPGSKKVNWRPHFTYFGFRYMHLQCPCPDAVKITDAKALFIHNDFRPAGNFTSSSADLNKLQEVFRQSMLTNFTGIPTDCPHREKNGWTGDQAITAAAILWNYHAVNGYKNYLQIIADAQRASGELPCIAPTADWYMLCGPAWDGAFFEILWEIYRFYGDDAPIKEHYQVMKRYFGFIEKLLVNGLPEHGLQDWFHPEMNMDLPDPFATLAPARLSSSAFLYGILMQFRDFARMTGNPEDVAYAENFAGMLKENMRREFLDPDGTVNCAGKETAAACFLYYGLYSGADEKESLLDQLLTLVRKKNHKACFGIFGSKWIPRVLADNGFADDALALLLQKEEPGYMAMLAAGATTLWEDWYGKVSLDHVMFSDPSAWCFEYLAGIKPVFEKGGFRKVVFSPCIVSALNEFSASYTLADGRQITAGWRKENGRTVYSVSLPEGIEATLQLNGREETIPAGVTEYTV